MPTLVLYLCFGSALAGRGLEIDDLLNDDDCVGAGLMILELVDGLVNDLLTALEGTIGSLSCFVGRIVADAGLTGLLWVVGFVVDLTGALTGGFAL